MLVTVSCPANTSSTVTANGSARRSRACRRRSRTSARKVRGAEVSPGGTVASQGRSHSALRRRTSFQALASPIDSGRSPTLSERSCTRHGCAPGPIDALPGRLSGRSR